MPSNEIKVWDIVVRSFHWVLVGAFTIAFLTEEGPMDVHVAAGYTIAGLLAVRIVWGLVGSRHARFSDFIYRPRVVVQFLKDTLHQKAKRYIGHNPAGGAMILLLLLNLIIITITGFAVYGIEDHAGPMAAMMAGAGESAEDALEEVHEFFSWFTLILVVFHVAGVVMESRLHGENLVRAMVNGRKRA